MSGMYVMLGSKIAGGFAQKNADDVAAREVSQEAGQSVASGIQASIADRRRASYVASSARARTAASGMTTTGTTAVANVGTIRGEGEYRALTDLYQGADRAQELTFRADQLRNQGDNAVASSVLSGASSFYDKYAADTLRKDSLTGGTSLTSSKYSGGYSDTGGPLDFISG